MAPNNISSANSQKINNTIKSSFPNLQTYSGKRGEPLPNIFSWLEVKRRDDNIGDNYWRVHDKLYDLEDFINKHPGGSDWLRVTKGSDITEAFEASHVINVAVVEKTLSRYYVKDANHPRNSPYTFKHDGFYMTLKRKIEPILKKVGIEPTPELLRLQDSLGMTYFIFAILSVWLDSRVLQIIAGVALSMCITGAHNFFHKKDSWRQYYFDLSPLSSHEWRISHALSHHFYPNTILDFEILMGEPLVEMLTKEKQWFRRYPAIFYVHIIYVFFFIIEIPKRSVAILQGKQAVRKENFIIFFELVLFVMIAPSIWSGFKAWITIFLAASYTFIVVSNHAVHHDTTCFHDGDEARPEPDFGLCQLDATKSKSDWYHKPLLAVITTFGEHQLHHLFPTICHSKLHYIKPILEETLKEFYEHFPEMTQLELFIGSHLQMARTKPNTFPYNKKGK